ncbi:DMT family transporter [Bacillus badius]|uniref:Permease of the drug/metabolite transporter (DMT) superfamily n=1 Tax=Bacillus badius TaxID=1455 RepID=A0ABR5ARS9_BACBA|nr:DMT family transporter [Bacillus badius]KIL77442.1 Permease of the drug/metabolite transporter (DMT) superfamily [Bacillus badius]KZN98224.1 multidrug transporter [Bacillus badius]KZR58510.1 multidrug transporter [Bacillus badius]MED0667612.1 DMT family transporter [Bacillus badius]MED4717218.1 DMT family transporter [Bacillus badius]
MNAFKADLLMLFVTLCWGSSYLFMKMGLASLSEFNVIALRFGLAFLLSAAFFHRRLRLMDREALKFGLLLGSVLFLVFTMLTYGLRTTSASNAGFLVSLTVIFVPLLHSFMLKNKLDAKLMASTLLALTGIGLLTIQPPFRILTGDLLCAAAAFFYALHIILVEQAAQKADPLNVGIIQLGVAGLLGFVFSLMLETPSLPASAEGWIAILMLSIVCSAFGFIIQTVAQKYTSSTKTGLIFSMEPVFAALFGFLFMKEVMNETEILGASLVLFSIVATSLKRGKASLAAERGKAGA